MMRKISNLRPGPVNALAVALACVTGMGPAHSQESSPTPESISQINVIDSVSPDDLKGKTLSLSRLSCEFFVIRFSDKGLVRGRFDQISEKIKASLQGRRVEKPVNIKSYMLHLNSGLQMEDLSQQAGAAVTGGSYVTKRSHIFPMCAKEKMKYGWFDQSEITNNNPPLIGEVSVVYDSKVYYSRYVISPSKNLAYSPARDQAAVKQVVIEHLNDDIVRQILLDIPAN